MAKTTVTNSSRGTVLKAIVFVVVFVGGCLLFAVGGNYFNGYVVNGSRPMPGDPAKYDPIAVYPQIAQFAGSGVQLLDIDMQFVKSDGTLDLTADYGASVTYKFTRILDTPTSDAPLGTGSNPGAPNAQQINVTVQKVGLQGGGRNMYYNFGMTPQTFGASSLTETIVDPPSCSLKDLWNAALKTDAPASAVATIHYGSQGYTFSIKDTQIYLRFDTKCQPKK